MKNNTVDTLIVKVNKEMAEWVKTALLKNGLLLKNAPIQSEGSLISIPVEHYINRDEVQGLLQSAAKSDGLADSIKTIEFERKNVTVKERASSNYLDHYDFPQEVREYMPSSWDTIGDLILVKINDEVLDYKKEIGTALLKAHKSINGVHRVIKVSGETRVRELEQLAGDKGTVTITKEFGVRMKIDPSEVYYSPRLATERWRIVRQVKDNEIILDMFAGIGPFSLLIAHHTRAESIDAVDINPQATSLLHENAFLNKINNIALYTGDAGMISKRPDWQERYDRIIMNLPHSSMEFFQNSLGCIKNGGMIHLYLICSEEKLGENIRQCRKTAEERNCEIYLNNKHLVRTYSPLELNYCCDILVNKL